MTRKEFMELTGEHLLLLDGATGSWLRKMGMPVGVCAEQWNLDHPEVITKLQEAYAEAGSQVVYAPTFSANRISLSRFGYQDRVEELNTRLVELSRRAVRGKALVAGDLTTTGKAMGPGGEVTYEELFDVYREQAEALANAGADLLVAETLLSVEEATAALDGAQAVCDLPVMCSLTLEADGSALYGGNAVEMMETLQHMGASAAGLNCSVGPDQLEAVVASMKEAAQIPVLVKPNAGLPVIDAQGAAHYSMGPEAFARSMKKLVERGAGIVGGCCGTEPEHIRRLAEVLGRF